MIQCYITDRHQLGDDTSALLANIARQCANGVDWIQIREKDLGTQELADLVRQAVEATTNHVTKIFVNSRLDVALACRAHGLHLPSNSPPPSEFRRIVTGANFKIGVSCHTLEELLRAETEGADYALLGPVFQPLSKRTSDAALGLEQFRLMVEQVRIPVLALGGIAPDLIPGCLAAGASGIAAISLFQATTIHPVRAATKGSGHSPPRVPMP